MDSDPDLEIIEKDSGMSSLGGSKDETPERRAVIVCNFCFNWIETIFSKMSRTNFNVFNWKACDFNWIRFASQEDVVDDEAEAKNTVVVKSSSAAQDEENYDDVSWLLLLLLLLLWYYFCCCSETCEIIALFLTKSFSLFLKYTRTGARRNVNRTPVGFNWNVSRECSNGLRSSHRFFNK